MVLTVVVYVHDVFVEKENRKWTVCCVHNLAFTFFQTIEICAVWVLAIHSRSFSKSSIDKMMAAKDSAVDTNTFSLRPSHKRKFKPAEVKREARKILEAKLEGQEYTTDNMQQFSREIADQIRDKVRLLDYERYKIIVNCVIGEQRGEGVRMGCKCFWDSDTDNFVEEVYVSKHLFAVVTVFGLYQY